MWSHYANGHRGCCIEVAVEDDDNTLNIKMQEEVRYLSTSLSYLKIRITKIYFGHKMLGSERRFIRKLVAKINPKIEVGDMSKMTFFH